MDWFDADWIRELAKHLASNVRLHLDVTVHTQFGPYHLDLLIERGARRIGFTCGEDAGSLGGLWRDSALIGSGAVGVVYRLRPLDLALRMADCLYVICQSDPRLFRPRGQIILDTLASDTIQRCRLPREEVLVQYPKECDDDFDTDPSGDPEDVIVVPSPRDTEGSLYMVRRDWAVIGYWYEYARNSGAQSVPEVMQRFAEEHLRKRDDSPTKNAELQRAEGPGSDISSEICRWVRVGEGWAITGPESVLMRGLVVVKARNKEPTEAWVKNVRQWGNIWIADKVTRREAKHFALESTKSAQRVMLPIPLATNAPTPGAHEPVRAEPRLPGGKWPADTPPSTRTSSEVHEALLFWDWL